MKPEIKQVIIRYLQSVIAFNPVINAQDEGQCIYCGTELDRGWPHKPNCHYLEAKRLLKEFKSEGGNQ